MTLKKIVKLRKIGNSLTITIPKELLDSLKWKQNDQILLETEEEIAPYLKGPEILRVGKIK